MANVPISIESLLLESGLVAAGALARAQAEQQRTGGRLEQILLRQGAVGEEQLLRFFAGRLGLEFLEHPERMADPEVAALVPSDFVMRHQLLPLCRENGGLLAVTADPFDLAAIEDLHILTRLPVRPALAQSRHIEELIEQLYMEQMLRDIADLETESNGEEELQVGDLQKMAREALVIKLLNMIIRQAIQERASDIHLEPFHNTLKVRYRIDGVLHERPAPPKRMHQALVSRVKIMADMDIAERRLPQDGRIRLKFSGRQIDMRVSTVPTLFGEGVVIRLLDKSTGLLDLGDLGMGEDVREQFARLISRPHGIILVTGPTGSGKTTTLYAALGRISTPDKKVITIEDPAEYELPGANQIQVRPNIGLTFASGLRHIVRQDPDIIMVGEIRDTETAEIAIHAALTGHLVFSTLHTNDAPGAITRLLDMGIEPYLVASSVIGVLAQRLVRVLCRRCRAEQPCESEPARELGLVEGSTVWAARGCDACRGSGYMGRSGLFELLPVDDVVRSQILAKTSAGEIKQSAVERGMRTLLADGRRKIAEGKTTVAEVLRVCERDEI